MSKGLEALKLIYNSLINDIELEEDEFYNPNDDIVFWKERYNVVKKELNALEIIKNKKVNLFHIWVFNDYEQYKEHYPFAEYNTEEDMLAFEEFDLLKEWLEE